jgi:hypothetical protein
MALRHPEHRRHHDMTFRSDVWAIDGNLTDALLARLMNQAATGGSQGVVGHLDCQVLPTGPATAGIIITPGGVNILGAESANQGTYTGWNVGNDTTLSIASTGGSPRSDMVIARAEDPTWPGSPWGNPASGQIIFPRVLSNVGSSATTVPGGYSAIPLARIDMPASTSTVSATYIHDLRQVGNPQRQLGVLSASGPGSPAAWTVGTSPIAWPPGANWQVAVPSWATSCVITWWIVDLYANTNTQSRGFVNPVFGASVSAPNLSFPQTLVSIQANQQNQRISAMGATQQSIGPSLRGTTQTLQFAQVTDGSHNGLVSVDEGSQYSVLYQFQQNSAAA